jgi:ATP-binding cassette, subfamily B, bacterial
MSSYKYIYSILLDGLNKRSKLASFVLVSITLSKLAFSTVPLLIGRAVDTFTSKEANSLHIVILEILAIWIFIYAFQPFQARFQSSLVQSIIKENTLSWYRQLFDKELKFFSSNNAARVTNIMNRSITAHEKLLNQIIEIILPITVELMIAGTLLIKLGGIICFTLSTVLVFLQIKITLRQIANRRPIINSINDIEDRAAEESTEILRNGFIFQIYQGIQIAIARLEKVYSDYEGGAVKLCFSGARLGLIPFNFQIFSQICGIILSAYLIQNNNLSVGQAIAMISLMTRFSSSTGETVGAFRYLDQFKIDIQGLQSLLSEKSFTRVGLQKSHMNSLTIKTFNYNKDNFNLQSPTEISFNKGDRVAIVGPSGNGKSSLLEYIAGIENSGRENIFIDQVGLDILSSQSQLDLIRYCPQEAMIFSGTLSDNLLLKSPQNFNCQTFENLHLGHLNSREKVLINTNLISGGEARRLSLARNFYHNGEIHLFDEPTTGLNEQLRNEVWQQIFDRTRDKILICVTHDESILSKFNRIIKVENGIAKEVISYLNSETTA